MNNTFLEIFKKAIVKDIVRVTYAEKQDVTHSKFFLKASDKKFYNAKTDTFNLVSHIDNKLKTIKACDIHKFESASEQDEIAKEHLVKCAEQLKNDYEELLNFDYNNSFENLDDHFFNEDINFNDIKIACMLGLSSFESFKTGGADALIKMKEVWKKKIESHKEDVLKYLKSEIDLPDCSYDADTVKEIMNLIVEFNADEQLKLIHTKEELFQYWPSILLPAPDFVNDIYLLCMGNKQ